MIPEPSYSTIRPADLPAPPQAALEIMKACSNSDVTHRELAQIATNDPILSAELLRIANSPFYGIGKEVSSIGHAVTILGLKALRNLVLCISVRDAFGKKPLEGFNSSEFWEDALCRAVACKILAKFKNVDPDDCFTMGLLQDFGLLILIHLHPEHAPCWSEIRSLDPEQRIAYESKLFGNSHDQVLMMLAKTWKLPEEMALVMGYHHLYDDQALDSRIEDKCRILNCADWMACVYVSQGKNDVLERTRNNVISILSIGQDQVDDSLAQIPPMVEEASTSLGLRVSGQFDFDELIKQANVQLAEDNLSYQELTWQLNKALKERDEFAEELSREMNVAQEIQQHLLPEKNACDLPIFGINKAAKILSGDFYDFFTTKSGLIYFNLADVSGKGITAALLMTKACSLFRCLAKEGTALIDLVSILNREICETATRGMFVTMVAGCYDPVKDQIKIVNAGHIPVLIYRPDGKFIELSAQSAPVGIMVETEFKEVGFTLGKNVMYAFTDGVTEAKLGDGQMLMLDGLKELIREYSKTAAENRLDKLINHLSKEADFAHDDITLLLLDNNRDC